MANVRVCSDNYLTSDLVSTLSYSSQVTTNPASNLYLTNRRSQTWRSLGCFEVTSANKTIVIKESTIGTLTANIAEATYTSDSSFLAAVKAALEVVGASTYTVERVAATKKIKITSNGLGGNGLFQLLWTNVSTTAADLLGFSTASDDTGALNYTADNVRIHTSEWVKWDLGIVSDPKAFIFCPKLNESLGISTTATIKLQANASDSWTSPAVDITLTHNDNAVSYFASAGIGGYRYWRLKVIDKDNANGYIEIAKAYLGDLIEPTRGSIQFPLNQRFRDLAEVKNSQMGVRFTSQRQQVEEFDLNWFGLSVADYENIKEFIKATGLGTPFFICLDPNEVISTDEATYIKLVHFLDALPEHTLVSPQVWTGRWEIVEVA